LLVQCAWGLTSLHAKHILHADLKPENLMVIRLHGPLRVPQVAVGDLGRSIQCTRAGVSEAAWVGCTPHYAAPEVLLRQFAAEQKNKMEASGDGWSGSMPRVGAPSDVYSLGLLAYELLTGAKIHSRQAHAMTTQDEVAAATEGTRDAWIAADERLWELPDQLQALIEGCLCHDPSIRPPCHQVAAALQGYMDSYHDQYMQAVWQIYCGAST
jgi:serine/threonine-protein kinase